MTVESETEAKKKEKKRKTVHEEGRITGGRDCAGFTSQ